MGQITIVTNDSRLCVMLYDRIEQAVEEANKWFYFLGAEYVMVENEQGQMILIHE